MARRVSPCRESSTSSRYSAVDVCFAGDLDFIGDERIVRWAVNGQRLATGRRAVFAVDEEVGLEVSHDFDNTTRGFG